MQSEMTPSFVSIGSIWLSRARSWTLVIPYGGGSTARMLTEPQIVPNGPHQRRRWAVVVQKVKTSLDLTNRQTAMSQAEAVRFVRRQLRRPTKDGKRQLSDERPGLLVIGAFEVDADTFEALTKGAEFVLSRQNCRPSLAAIVISRTATEGVVEAGRPIVNFGHASRIRSNPNYSGNIRFTGSWDGKWKLRKFDGGSLG
jgi:hypothetical protein